MEVRNFTLWHAKAYKPEPMNFESLDLMKQRNLAALYANFAQNFRDFEPISVAHRDANSSQLGTLTSAANDAGMDLLEHMADFAHVSLIIESLEWLNLGTELRLSNQGYFTCGWCFSVPTFQPDAATFHEQWETLVNCKLELSTELVASCKLLCVKLVTRLNF